MGVGTVSMTVLDVCVIGEPSGGVPVIVALFSWRPASWSASVNTCSQVKVVAAPASSALPPGPPAIDSQRSSVRLPNVSAVLPVLVTMIS